jgi:hypothetical protein
MEVGQTPNYGSGKENQKKPEEQSPHSFPWRERIHSGRMIV